MCGDSDGGYVDVVGGGGCVEDNGGDECHGHCDDTGNGQGEDDVVECKGGGHVGGDSGHGDAGDVGGGSGRDESDCDGGGGGNGGDDCGSGYGCGDGDDDNGCVNDDGDVDDGHDCGDGYGDGVGADGGGGGEGQATC